MADVKCDISKATLNRLNMPDLKQIDLICFKVITSLFRQNKLKS